MVRFEIVIKTDTGRVRQRNEDSAIAIDWRLAGSPPGDTVLLAAVSDGMGGHSNGHVASKMVLRSLGASLAQGLANAPLEGVGSLSEEQLIDLLASAVQGAVQRLNQAAEHGLNDMGATLCTALVVENQAFIANIGDSRAYLIDGSIQQLTTDHSVVAQLAARGELTPEEARVHPRRNEIYRMIGFGRPAHPDFATLQLEPGDVLMLCSDGLTNLVTDEEIREALVAGSPLEAAAEQLIDLANSRGGDDNITIVAVRALTTTGGR